MGVAHLDRASLIPVGYVLAADGGNSKTDLALLGLDGAVLARVTGPGTRPHVDGAPGTADALAALVRSARERAGVAGPATAGCFLLANVDFPDEEAAMHALLAERGLATELEVGNDTVAVLRAGSRSGWGIAVVSGAGINAVGQRPDGTQERFLGLGAISGDWGGGWGVAVAGIAAAVRAGDGRGPATALRAAVAATFGADAEDVAVAYHRDELDERRVFDFAPAVFRVAAAGDAVAIGLIERLGDEVLAYVVALVDRMGLAGTEVEVVLGGSALQAGNPVLDRHLERGVARLAPRARLVALDVAPVAGAAVSALRAAGADVAAVERARAGLGRVSEPAAR